jgi:purine-nucleoside phosphorylase
LKLWGGSRGVVREIKTVEISIQEFMEYFKSIGLESWVYKVWATLFDDVLEALVSEARNRVNRFSISPVVSSDAFYAEDEEFISQWVKVGATIHSGFIEVLTSEMIWVVF